MQNIFFNVKKLKEEAIIPTRGSIGAAGYDLYALLDEPLVINPNERTRVPTGIAISIPENTVALIYARSGLALKHGIHMANDVGVVDCDYRGEILIPVHNMSETSYTINNGDRVAQLVITPCYTPEITVVDELDSTVRGESGFGSTGKN